MIADYFAAFNAGDVPGMLACLSDDVAHHVNEGQVRRGKEPFAAFCDHMSSCYRRRRSTDMVLFEARGTARARRLNMWSTAPTSKRMTGCPRRGVRPTACPRARSSMSSDGKITRVTTYYNLADWIASGLRMKVEALTGDALRGALPDVARLRIEVFRAWPYLYDGDLAYEEAYLRPYRDSPQRNRCRRTRTATGWSARRPARR